MKTHSQLPRQVRGVICGLALVVGLAAWLDPPISASPAISGTIVSTQPSGKWRTGYGTIFVRLKSGQVVLASMPRGFHFPYPDGTPVTVTPLDTAIFKRRSYVARLSSR